MAWNSVASERTQRSLERLERALARLSEALDEPPDGPLVLDGTIQRFEFVFELAWKTMRHCLAEEGTETATPRETLRAAYAAGIVSDEDGWLALLQARNETSHTYDDEVGRHVYAAVATSIPLFEDAVAAVAARIG